MTKEDLYGIVKSLQEKSFEFKLDTHINIGKCYFRGIFIFNKSEGEAKNIFGNGLLKDFKVKKSFVWYLGEKKKALLFKPKKELILEIPEIEALQVNNTV